jgi:hypothetical protein
MRNLPALLVEVEMKLFLISFLWGMLAWSAGLYIGMSYESDVKEHFQAELQAKYDYALEENRRLQDRLSACRDHFQTFEGAVEETVEEFQ